MWRRELEEQRVVELELDRRGGSRGMVGGVVLVGRGRRYGIEKKVGIIDCMELLVDIRTFSLLVYTLEPKGGLEQFCKSNAAKK